ncbi:MAG: patatin-like phospholipase family protein [Clostridia bacterium]|nr:patatin-like phospholipase family protein [Clostridia bacterium]
MAVSLQESHQTPRKKVGVAFGGGGLRGAAHVGVLQVLEEHHVPIDFVAGTSIGSAVAALYASGYDWRRLDFLFTKYDIESLLKVRLNRKGLIPADGYTELIRVCTGGRKIEEMQIPLKIVAVDLLSRKKIVFSRGDTAIAVRASSAIPGVFTPVKMGNMLLVDGYLLDNCPGGLVRDMGADIVIAIDLYYPDPAEPTNILDIVTRALDVAATGCQQIDADVVLRPIRGFVAGLDPQNISQCRSWGEECARKHIGEILKLIGGTAS